MEVKQGKRSVRRPTLKRKPEPKVSKGLLTAVLLTLVAIAAYTAINGHTYDAKQRNKLENTFQQLQKTQQELNQSKDKNSDSQKQLEDINKQLEETKKQLQSKKDGAKAYAAELPKPAPAPAPAPVPAGDAKAFIYSHESGNRTNAINASSGACGLGQALPCSKLPCSLSDYACQDAWFTNYMIQRYGTWENARAFWLIHKWW